jgi:hypothetical protein
MADWLIVLRVARHVRIQCQTTIEIFCYQFIDFVFLYTWPNYFRERLNIFRELESSVSVFHAGGLLV